MDMAFALGLYRCLRDHELDLKPETYAALVSVCAAAGDATQAFAFYKEAIAVCGAAALPSELYAHFLRAYVASGYVQDALTTLDVLGEAGAPLTRQCFHEVLAATDLPPSTAEKLVERMEAQFAIAPSVKTYALLVAAHGRAPPSPLSSGVSTVLSLFDIDCKVAQLVSGFNGSGIDSSVKGSLKYDSEYAQAVQKALLRTHFAITPQTEPYVRPLLQVAQHEMNEYLQTPPQSPTSLPARSRTVAAVLSPEVVAQWGTLMGPIFSTHFSSIVLPFSTVVAFRETNGDSIRSNDGQSLRGWLGKYSELIHIMSLEEELAMSADWRRYGFSVRNLRLRPLGIAANLARGIGRTRVYKENEARVVLVCADKKVAKHFRERQHLLHFRGISVFNPQQAPDW